MKRRAAALGASGALAASLVACRDVSDFSTSSGHIYEGPITGATFVRAGLGNRVNMCLTIDTGQLQTTPGALSTDDGLFHETPLRSIPQFWQDPLSTFNFGEGRIQNEIYVAHGNATDAAISGDVFVVVSFMVAGTIEVRLLRGAPGGPSEGSSGAEAPPVLFGVFSLTRRRESCPF